MKNELSISVAGNGDQWDRIAEHLEEFGQANDWPPDIEFSIRLILEELVLNAVDYGTEDKSTEIRLKLLSEADYVQIDLSDNGRPYNPLVDAPAPDLDSSADDRKVGGQGVHLVKQLSDEVSYRHAEGLNALTIVKRR